MSDSEDNFSGNESRGGSGSEEEVNIL